MIAGIKLVDKVLRAEGVTAFGDFSGKLVQEYPAVNDEGEEVELKVLNFVACIPSTVSDKPLVFFENLTTDGSGKELLSGLLSFQSACVKVLGRPLKFHITVDCALNELNPLCDFLNNETAVAYKQRRWSELERNAEATGFSKLSFSM